MSVYASDAERDADLKQMKKDLATLVKVITGNGDPSKGMIVRLALIERTIKNVTKVAWGVAIGAAGAFGTWIFARMMGA